MARRSLSMRSRLIPLVLAYVDRSGGDATQLADQLDVPIELRDPSAWSMSSPAAPIERVARVCDEAARILHEPRLGLRVAAALPRGTYGVLEFAARNAPSIREAARRLVRFQRLINDAVVYELIDEGGRTELRHTLPGRAEGVGAQGNLFTIGALERFLVEMGVTASPIEVRLAHAGPQIALEELAAPVRFGAGHNALVYPSSAFDTKVTDADPALLPVLDAYASRLLPREDPAAGWRSRVRDHLRRALAGGAPPLPDTARALGTSARNLQRQLAEAETSYSRVIDGLREEEARRLTLEPDLSLDEIAFTLGYSDARSFVRAFKRWTGTSPGRFRRAGASRP